MNCKTLILSFLLLTMINFFTLADYLDPIKILADGLKMTRLAQWMWTYMTVLVFDGVMVFSYALLFDDAKGQEIVVLVKAAMYVIAGFSFYPLTEYLSALMGANHNTLWTKAGVMVGVCIVAVVGGRMGRHSKVE